MNKRKNHKVNGNGASPAVRLEFHHPTATSVSVAGTFNQWRPGATEMVAVGEGRWLKELVLPPGRYEYRLVVDGTWMPDPLVTETAPNAFGEPNSVITVSPALSRTQGRGSENERKPMNNIKAEVEHQRSPEQEPNFQTEEPHHQQREATPIEKRFLKTLHWMRCPKCGQSLATERHSAVEIDFCSDCREVCLTPAALDAVVAPENDFLRSCLRNFHRH